MKCWESYIRALEDEHYRICYDHRKQLGLPVDFDLETLECKDEKCCSTCPFNTEDDYCNE
jgi:hypothetical protein